VKSKVALLTHGTSDYPFMYIPARTHVIQTYHGFPTKRGEFMRLEGEDAPGPVESFYLNRRFQPIDTFLSTSDFVTQIFSKRFGLPIERFLKIGFPVNDELLERSPDPEWIKQVYPHADANTKLILYAPTFRYKSATQLFPFQDLDTGDLSRFLEHNNLVLAIRTHPNDKVELPQWFGSIDRIVITSDKKIEQVNDLIVHSSAIITDYSSVYLEGLLRDIPPVFIPYDLKEYERGFPFEYEDVTPGPHVRSFVEWKEAIQEALNGAKRFEEHRNRVRNLFFERLGADSTVRLWEYISRL
jgi:CDP-glycerol glycerophosphotransferase (TagB/SpsB family)